MIPAAWPFVAALSLLALAAFLLGHALLAMIPLMFATAVGLFFRDPERAVPGGDDLVVSPADGRVVEVARSAEGGPARVAIFLSLFNVHVNRSPVAGRVRSVTYRPGRFRPAYEVEASSQNERNDLELEGPGGSFGVSQIAGLVARRIRCSKRAGDEVARGERIGYIAFGSRTELTLPSGAEILVEVGQKVRGAETVVARLSSGAGTRP
jgi:phosphatidylserine decarboxylase